MTHAGLVPSPAPTAWSTVPTRVLEAGGIRFAYRQLGPRGGVAVVFLTHPAAVLDNWEARVMDGVAARRHVITFDNRGVGASSGTTPSTIEEMAADAVRFDPLKAIHRWGTQAPQDLSKGTVPALVVNGDSDRMVPTSNTLDLGRRLPNGEVVVHEDAGHGGVFQCHDPFVPTTLAFLAAPRNVESVQA